MRIGSIDDPVLAFINNTKKTSHPSLSWNTQQVICTNVEINLARAPLKHQQVQAEAPSCVEDTTQDALLFNVPVYCHSLMRDIGAPGYWTQFCYSLIHLNRFLFAAWLIRHLIDLFHPVETPYTPNLFVKLY